MNKTIKNKLLHFYTTGSIYEDFAESRTKKVAKLRSIIRACFYVHCAAAVICIMLAAVLHAGTAGVIAVTFCEIVLATLAFLAVGDMTLIKTLLCCGDFAFASAMFVTGALNGVKAPFLAAGAVTVIDALIALGALAAAMGKIFLEGFSPLSLRREHYTLLPNFSYDGPRDVPETHNKADEPAKDLPPRSEFQELADKLKEVFRAPKKETASGKSNAETASDTQSKTEVTE